MSRPYLANFLAAPIRRVSDTDRLTRGMSRRLNEGVDDLPIRAPRDDWETVVVGGVESIRRTFDLKSAAETKMILCDIIDIQEQLGHHASVSMEGSRITVTSTTHEHGETTERDRELARCVDTAYNEMRMVYK
jgi:pterin-4a-carbinolamine dehydratase